MRKYYFVSKLTDSEIYNFVEQYNWIIGVNNKAKLPYILVGKNENYISHLDDGSISYAVTIPAKQNSDAHLIINDFGITLDAKDLSQEETLDFIDRLVLANLYFRKLMLNKNVKNPEYKIKLMNYMLSERNELLKILPVTTEPNNSVIERLYGNETYLFGAPIELARNLDNAEIQTDLYDTEKLFYRKSTEQIYGSYVQLKFKLPENNGNGPKFE